MKFSVLRFPGFGCAREISPKVHVKNGVKNENFTQNFTLLGRSAEKQTSWPLPIKVRFLWTPLWDVSWVGESTLVGTHVGALVGAVCGPTCGPTRGHTHGSTCGSTLRGSRALCLSDFAWGGDSMRLSHLL